MKPRKRRSGASPTMAACAAIILLMSAGCSTSPTRAPLPARPAPMPGYDGRTYQDVIQYALRLQEWGQACLAVDEANRKALGGKP